MIAVFVIALAAISFYFWQNHEKWQGYRNDPNKSKIVKQIDDLSAKKDKTADDWLTIGNAYYSLGENSEAINAYKKAVVTLNKGENIDFYSNI